jgi:hypothetical protein
MAMAQQSDEFICTLQRESERGLRSAVCVFYVGLGDRIGQDREGQRSAAIV